jgi:gamma-butyrobetaine dioxygenase/trimethyllysine dioxygenase
MAATRIEVADDGLRVVFADGVHADYHHRWLRHNSDGDRHPTTGERTLCSSELPDALAPSARRVDDEALRVLWSDSPAWTSYPLPWLREHAYALGRVAPPPPPVDVTSFELPFDDDLAALAHRAEQVP